ncbi:hypothetical protein KRR39_11090 [Nocardioides panacis]|uniref:Cellulose synthase n=1 Tax=Nocardioides panacis TaxID=2849501 RepID=A0A975T2C0_9ACTN|nr:hypothetical protein [Nocardioides panacis]QWZ10216.1 hypothetical protein KRR39_11090 [Nocardioides panacis]
MDSIDSSTWQAVGVTLSVVGLVLSALLWKRRGAAAGLRAVAWSLLPAALGLTGTLRLVWQVGDLVVTWATRLVFSPVVWAGIVLAGVSVVLFGVSAAMRARGVGGSTRAAGSTAAAGPAKGVGGAGGEAALPTKRSSRKAGPAVGDEDMDDIEAILRKHGIQ